jgi:hypothetical protein
MKKFAILMLVGAALFLATTPRLSAQTGLSLNFGVVTDKTFTFNPFLWTGGLTLDLFLSPNLSLSPEGYVVVNNFDFGAFFVAPAVLLNFHGAGFFVGGGLTKWWLVGSDIGGSYASDFGAKLNFGLKAGGLRFTIFAVTPFTNFLKEPILGLTLGFVL